MGLQVLSKFIGDQQIVTRTLADANVTSAKLQSSIALSGTPTAPTASSGTSTTQLATTAFVQTAISAAQNGILPKQSVAAATTAAGTLATSFAAGQVIDGYTLVTGDRLLIKNQAAPADNGIYIVAASGAPSRSADFQTAAEINGAWVAIQNGSQAGYVFVQFGTVTTVGTDAINFEYWNPIAGLVGGNGISITGATIAVNLAATSGLTFSSSQLLIKLEATNPTLQIDGSNQLGVKLDGARAITTGASGVGVNVDGSTIVINTNQLKVGTISLTSNVSGILPVANGGTGANALTAGSLVVGNGTSAVSLVAPGSNGNILTVVAGAWTSAAPSPVYTWNMESFVLSSTDITNQYVDLAFVVQTSSIVAFVERLGIQQGTDYTTSTVSSKTRITFAGSLATGGAEALVAGDTLFFTYQH